MKKLLSLLIILSLIFSYSEASAVTYSSGKQGGCYTMKKSKKTGKMYKYYVDKKFCAKKK